MVKKTDYGTKISEIEKKLTDHKYGKYITTPEFNKFTAENFAARLAQANLIKKKQILMQNCQVLTENLLQIKQDFYSLKMN